MSPLQRRAAVAGIVALHAAGVWALLQVEAVREAVQDAAPMFVSMVMPPAPPPLTPAQPPRPQPLPKRAPPVPAVLAAAPSPAPAAVLVPPFPPEPAPAQPPAPAPVAPVAIAAAVPPAPPPPPPAPKAIPASAVEYTVAPVLAYPALSIRNRETGSVVVRADIGAEGGAPRGVVVDKSSGHRRLDDAAVNAVRNARFKPPRDNGQPIAGWALIPLNFDLEK